MNENELWENLLQDLKALLPPFDNDHLKIIMTRRNFDGGPITDPTRKVIEFKPLSPKEWLILLSERIDRKLFENPVFKRLFDDIAKKSKGLPATITMVAATLNYIQRHDFGSLTLEIALEKAANYEIAAGYVNPLIYCMYEMLPSSVLQNCFWHSIQFFCKYGGVHYNELITHWIMEGYYDPIDIIDNAYQDGHCALMELINRGMLKMQEDNIVVLEGAALNMIDFRPQGFGGTASVGLTTVFDNDQRKVLERITQIDSMIKTSCNPKSWKEVSTLLIDGSRLCQEVRETFFSQMQGLQILAIFNSRFKSLISSSFKMNKLLVLILRRCDLLDNIIHIKKLKTLTVLEISGASNLESLPKVLFDEMTRLQSLNLSGLRIKELPSSLSNLRELRFLILRGCSQLETLPPLRGLSNLLTLDLSGAESLKSLPEQTLLFCKKLQMIDLSGTKIERMPKFLHLKDLTRILLRGCSNVHLLPTLNQLTSLKILDASGVMFTKFKDLEEKSKDSVSDQLPLIPCNLSQLYLSGCSKLEQLPSTKSLKNLELLDLSNSSKLVEIEDKSLQHLIYLRYLNLSNTNFKKLPSLSFLRNLCQLFIKNCPLLKNLPEMKGLTKLEVLDLSGCHNLVELPNFNDFPKLEVLDLSGCGALMVDGNVSLVHMSRLRELNLDQCGAKPLSELAAESLEHMTQLQILKLSGITKELSSISKLTNLTQLSLKNCPGLNVVPSLEALSKLKALDLSGSTAFVSLPSCEKLTNLQKLLLNGCSSLKELPSLKPLIQLAVLDLSKAGIKDIPHEISCLLPDLKIIKEVEKEEIKSQQEDVSWGYWGIFKPPEILANGRKPSILVNGNIFFQFPMEDPDLQKTFFKRIAFPDCPNGQSKDGESYCHGVDVVFSNIYFRTRFYFPCHEKDVQFLEIRGFNSFPTGVEDILKRTMTSCTDFNKLKGCWLESCPKMESIFSEETHAKLSEKLEILWISYLPKLRSLFDEKLLSVNFENLTHLHLDCCPKLEKVFPSSQFPENLEILEIKFCDSLKTVFEPKKSGKCKSSKLHTLILFELPELKSIGTMLPPIQKVKIKNCWQLGISEESLKSTGISSEDQV